MCAGNMCGRNSSIQVCLWGPVYWSQLWTVWVWTDEFIYFYFFFIVIERAFKKTISESDTSDLFLSLNSLLLLHFDIKNIIDFWISFCSVLLLYINPFVSISQLVQRMLQPWLLYWRESLSLWFGQQFSGRKRGEAFQWIFESTGISSIIY